MKRALVLFTLSVLMLGIVGCDNNSFDAKSTEQIHRENGVPVRTQIIESTPLEAEFTYNSVLTGFKESSASSMVSDRVDRIHHNVGDVVSKDEVIISFPDDNPSAQYLQAKAAYDHATTTLVRMRNLFKSGGISRQTLDEVETQQNVAKANYDAIKKAIKVKAPITGTITQISVRETDNVNPGDNLFTISNSNKLKAHLWITEDNIHFIKKNSSAKATWGNISLAGKITQVDLSLNRDKQAFGVIVEFDNPEAVPSGINAEISLFFKDNTPSIFLERKDVMSSQESHYVFVSENNHAVKKEVNLGRSYDTSIEVLSGLTDGDILITEGLQLLDDGTLIKVMDR